MRGSATILLLAVGTSAFAGTAWGQDATSDDGSQTGTSSAEGADSAEQNGVAEIVVTATRRSESLQKVPLTVSAFDGNRLETVGVKSAVDLPNVVSGLALNRFGAGTNSFLRGVGSNNTGFTSEPQIATYFDGFYLPYSGAIAFSFNNIERVEVLKGPQGTLYGRNSTGGLISVVTRDPGAVPRMDASIEYANYDTVSANIGASVPLSDTLSAGFAFTSTYQADGWGRNMFTGSETQKLDEKGVQGKIVWRPSGATKVTLEGFYDRLATDQGSVVAIFPGAVGSDGTPYLGEYRSSTRDDPRLSVETYLVGAKIEQDLGFADLTSLTGYQHSFSPTMLTQNGQPGKPVAGQSASVLDLTAKSRTITQELQLRSKVGDSPFDWIAGFFYYNNDNRISAATYGTCVDAICAPAPLPIQTISYPKTRSYSGYAEGTYRLTEATRLTLGLRYTDDEISITGTTVPFPGRPNTPAALPGSVVVSPGDPYPGNPDGIVTNTSFGKLTWKAVLAHDLTPDVHLYASYNRGFKSGSFNPTVFSNQPSRPEVLDAFELGVKSELFDRRLRANVAGFHYDYRDIQVRTTAPPAPPGLAILYNAAAARLNGVDADFELKVVPGLTLTGSAEYLDAKYTQFLGASCTTPRPIGGAVLGGNAGSVCDVSGNRMINAPRFSYTIGANYRFDTGVGEFALAVNDSHRSRYYWDPSNRLTQEPYHLLNASLTWTSIDRHIDVRFFAKNLTDSYYFVTAQQAANDVYVPGAPRTYGVEAGVHF
ncbi:TonB-dependent receptor [Stakelama tenebrarum]|uniref:TonB-dependent receptor n=1 Tax=Stakelama tenebrarum TaxID=2711215 RepID=A0A6G6Y216_9SPHN|nr:TonB-dependent receptor [Sphingosinithalassobacter tenebrarum]QIG78616.1 TonB-dependent receptor [Sphingosinithalassobacter tenebrarum]